MAFHLKDGIYFERDHLGLVKVADDLCDAKCVVVIGSCQDAATGEDL